jgi:predicted DNA-binding antitoxin AbrB/MazE fold protein
VSFNFDFDYKPKKFIDLETGEVLKLHPNQVKEEFVKQMNDFQKKIKLKCVQYGIEHIEADISKGFDQILLPMLRKRKKMR